MTFHRMIDISWPLAPPYASALSFPESRTKMQVEFTVWVHSWMCWKDDCRAFSKGKDVEGDRDGLCKVAWNVDAAAYLRPQ